jgi:hypothetical protein
MPATEDSGECAEQLLQLFQSGRASYQVDTHILQLQVGNDSLRLLPQPEVHSIWQLHLMLQVV